MTPTSIPSSPSLVQSDALIPSFDERDKISETDKIEKTETIAESSSKMLSQILHELSAFQERWSQDREGIFAQLSALAEQVKLFTEHANDLKEFEPALPTLNEKISQSIRNTINSCTEGLGEKLGKEAARTTEFVARGLAKAAYAAQDVIEHFKTELLMRQWRMMGVTVFTTITTCLLLVWLIIPKPTLPLSEKQIQYLNEGMKMERLWPTLTEWERNHWQSLMRKNESDE